MASATSQVNPTSAYQRIVCLTEETTEIIYRLGKEDHIVGISGFTVRPPRARKEKPRVSAFTSARLDKIEALEPDLVLGFSDLQADIAAELVRRGIEVHVYNQRSVAQILDLIPRVASLVGALDAGNALAEKARSHLDTLRDQAADFSRRPRVYFEEWDDPLICGIQWVSELIDLTGGDNVFAEKGAQAMGRDRIIANPKDVIDAAPDIIIGSWCGKKFRPEKVAARPGWDAVPAVASKQLHEIRSPIILQPGPAALFDGASALHEIFVHWNDQHA